jgi:hypothetical protein
VHVLLGLAGGTEVQCNEEREHGYAWQEPDLCFGVEDGHGVGLMGCCWREHGGE